MVWAVLMERISKFVDRSCENSIWLLTQIFSKRLICTDYRMFAVSGDYRKMLVLPENISWNIVHYDNPNADLIATDLQKLKNQNTVENLESKSNFVDSHVEFFSINWFLIFL